MKLRRQKTKAEWLYKSWLTMCKTKLSLLQIIYFPRVLARICLKKMETTTKLNTKNGKGQLSNCVWLFKTNNLRVRNKQSITSLSPRN